MAKQLTFLRAEKRLLSTSKAEKGGTLEPWRNCRRAVAVPREPDLNFLRMSPYPLAPILNALSACSKGLAAFFCI